MSEYPYLLMMANLWPGYCNNKLERMNIKVDKENGKVVVMVNGQAQKVRRFKAMNFGIT